MASSLLTPSIIAKEGLMQLDNNLVAAKTVYRGYEEEFGDTKIGDTLTIRKPVKYGLRSGSVASMQDATEGKVQIVVDQQQGVDLRFPTKDLTLTIDRFSERYLKHPMIALANKVDTDVLTALKNATWNYVGTPGSAMNGWASVANGAQRLDEMSVPVGRTGVLAPADYYGIAGNLTGLYMSDVAKTALEKAKLPAMAGLDLYSTQSTPVHTNGTMAGSPVIATNGTGVTTYASAKDTNQSTIIVDGATGSTTLNVGDVFTIAGVYAINPTNKQVMPYLQQFVVKTAVTLTGTGDNVVVSPAIIPLTSVTAGNSIGNQYATVSAAPAVGAALVRVGSANTSYTQSMAYHENAAALCMVPMELPEGAVKKARQSYKGLSIRVICDYDIINDINLWRLDILYGVKAVYSDLCTRMGR